MQGSAAVSGMGSGPFALINIAKGLCAQSYELFVLCITGHPDDCSSLFYTRGNSSCRVLLFDRRSPERCHVKKHLVADGCRSQTMDPAAHRS